jgi:exopolyphosphatase/guanosine-5'-triphosphate,3'-diphosphate pyrophosphatase
MWRLHHAAVSAAVVDVGSNTVRLHVARDGRAVFGERALLGLGEAVERFGSIPEAKLAEVAGCVAGYVEQARGHGADPIEVLVTSPGRQALNGQELLDRIELAARVPVRLLSGAEEARLAFDGALAATRLPNGRTVAVVDVGGGSTQITVGSRRAGPAWIRSVDVGSMRLAARCLATDPPGLDALRRARVEVDRLLDDLDPPLPRTALAVGGSARALRRVVGSARLGRDELEAAVELLAATPAEELVRRFDVPPGRARTLAAGAVILAAAADRLRSSLRVVRGGVREGAVLELEARRAAA